MTQRLLFWLPFALAAPEAQGQSPTPPRAPAQITFTSQTGRIAVHYQGRDLLVGTLTGVDPATDVVTHVDTVGTAISQVIKWTTFGQTPISLEATVSASDEAFPAEADRREDGLAVIRHSAGLSASLLNRAIYDRHADWVLSIDFPARATIAPLDSSSAGTRFRLTASGQEIAIRFRPRFYGTHRGLTAFAPWTRPAWRGSVAGWTSWYAFRDKVTEEDIARATTAIATTLARFGYQYLQIDDGFQQNPIGVPDHWLKTNAKFPHGLEGLVATITGAGLKPGLWTNVSFADRGFAALNPRYFVRTANGQPVFGNWIGQVMDGSNPATLDDLILPVYRQLRQMGWTYFKVDALRHLIYEGYNSHADYFGSRHLDRAAVFRHVVEAIRREIGPEAFLLGSWGIRPELVGLLDANRVGDDGFGFGGFAQYNSFNNVVWRNDPDHVELTPNDAYRATMAASLTGSLLMLTDKPEVYATPRVEAAKRAAPVLFTVPGQLFDLDPSRSSRIASARSEVSGAGPRPFDADQASIIPLYLLEINRPFERWMVVGRLGGEASPIRFADLGLDPAGSYQVFEFWTKRFLGSLTNEFDPGTIDSTYHAQVFCIRNQVDHPQVVATNRHISCGGVDLTAVAWDGTTLTGTSHVVAGDQYTIFLTEPAGYTLDQATIDGATATAAMAADLRTVSYSPSRSGPVTWRLRYRRH